MKTILSAAAVLALASAGALAQSPPPAQPAPPAQTTPPTQTVPPTQAAPPTQTAPSTQTSPGTPAAPPGMGTGRTVNAAPLENGANSFTEGQAMERFREAGITSVTGLAKDDNGIWRGRGQWQGRSVDIGLDYRGNLQAR